MSEVTRVRNGLAVLEEHYGDRAWVWAYHDTIIAGNPNADTSPGPEAPEMRKAGWYWDEFHEQVGVACWVIHVGGL